MSFSTGISCFSEGLRLARSRKIRPFILLPASVSLVVIGLGLYFGYGYVQELTVWIAGSLPDWLSFVDDIVGPILYVLGLLVGAWLFGFVSNIIGGPFLGELANAVENPEHRAQHTLAGGLLAAFGRELRKLRYHLPRLLGVFLLGFIPLINGIAPVLWLLFGGWMMAVQFCDLRTENVGGRFVDTLGILRQNRAAALGFGMCVTLFMAIPGVNFLVGPVAAAGGTVLMMRLQQSADL